MVALPTWPYNDALESVVMNYDKRLSIFPSICFIAYCFLFLLQSIIVCQCTGVSSIHALVALTEI